MSEPAIHYLRWPPWWNLWRRYHLWRALRLLRTGRWNTHFYVPEKPE